MKLPDQFAAKLLDSLRPREREALGLRFLDQFSVADMAELLQVKPDSASAHLSKGLSAVAKIISGSVEEARELLDLIGEVHARRKPKQTIRLVHREDEAVLGVMPHRQVMGGVVRESHTASDISSFYIIEIDGRSVSVAEARDWYLRSPLALGLEFRKNVLAMKGIKPASAFEHEANTYFFPVGYGCAELYYERNFLHGPLTLPLANGRTLMDHMPPMPALDREMRASYLPDGWPLHVMDLGEYRSRYDDDIASDAEEGLRHT
jgi:hypothetical protein